MTVSDLSTLVGSLKREVAIPGTFDNIFADTGQSDLIGTLADSFAQAQLDGWFGTMTLDLTDPLNPIVSPDLSLAGGALVVITAGIRFIRAQLRAQQQSATYKAGTVEYSVGYSASAMVQDLKDLQARAAALLTQSLKLTAPLDSVYDGYYGRIGADLWRWGVSSGFYPYELTVP